MDKDIARRVEEQQLAYLDIHELQQTVYHNRDFGGAVTVCLISRADGTVIARGVSVCSPLDSFHRSYGRVAARGRAIRAVRKGKDTGEMVWLNKAAANPSLHWAGVSFRYKSSWMPTLSKFEASLVSSEKESNGQ